MLARDDWRHASERIGSAHAARHDRSRPDGREHRAPADAGRSHVRRLRRQPATPSRRSPRRGRPGANSLDDFVAELEVPRRAWIMVPAGEITESTVRELASLLERGRHDHRRRQLLLPRRHPAGRRARRAGASGYLDCGTSGGVFGLERGFCLMVGGPDDAFAELEPIFALPRPWRRGCGADAADATASRRQRSAAICTAARQAPGTS